MFKIFLLMEYSRSPSNYLEKITLSNLTHIMSMNNLVAIDVKILRIDSKRFLQKNFTILICIKTQLVLYQTVN